MKRAPRTAKPRRSLERGFFFARPPARGTIDLASTFYGLLIFTAVYATYLFAPLVWKKEELKSLLKEVSYQLKNMPEDVAKEKIADAAKRELGVGLDTRHIVVLVTEDRVLLRVLWKPRVHTFFGETYTFPMQVEQKTTIFR